MALGLVGKAKLCSHVGLHLGHLAGHLLGKLLPHLVLPPGSLCLLLCSLRLQLGLLGPEVGQLGSGNGRGDGASGASPTDSYTTACCRRPAGSGTPLGR